MSQPRPNEDTTLPSAHHAGGTERTLLPVVTTCGALATSSLPGPRNANDENSPVTNDSSERDSSLGQASSTGSSAHSRPLHGKLACQACQRRKVKCSGQAEGQQIQYNLQCEFCTRSGVQCVWKPPKRNMPNANTRRRPNPAARSGSSQESGESSTLPQIRSACVECRRRKQKCTGERPSCQFCSEKGVECSYEVADGMTRTEDLKSKVREATERADRLDQLVGAMRRGTDQESSELLARLRVGATVDDLLDPETRVDHFPEYIRNGEIDRSAWLENSNDGMQAPTAETSRHAATTSATSPTYPFDFPVPRPQLSPQDIDMANNPFNRSFPSS